MPNHDLIFITCWDIQKAIKTRIMYRPYHRRAVCQIAQGNRRISQKKAGWRSDATFDTRSEISKFERANIRSIPFRRVRNRKEIEWPRAVALICDDGRARKPLVNRWTASQQSKHWCSPVI